MIIKELIAQLSRGEGPKDLESYLEDFVPNTLLKSHTLQQAYGVSKEEMGELYEKAYGYYQEDRYDQSIVLFRFLVMLNPFVTKYWMGLGGSQQLLKQYEKALHSYAIWSLLDGKNPMPHFQAYQCYTAEENRVEGNKALKAALELTANKSVYKQIREEVERCLQQQ
ncbi:MAG: Chaperone protein SicA [Chlamydiae bacterium]|nr:Chaperone protein SicA [Chlamydiota bacterium]